MEVRTLSNQQLLEHWRERLAGYRPEQQTVRAWCEREGITKNQFFYWKRRIGAHDRKDSPTVAQPERGGAYVRFKRLQVVPEPPVIASELAVNVGPARIAVSPGFDKTLLVSVVRALAEALAC